MPRESRLDHLYSGLTALERAKLVMKTWHDGTREDPAWRMTMPPRQGPAFNGHIYTMNAANLYLAQMINSLDADLQQLWERGLRFELLLENLHDLDGYAPSVRVPQRAGQTTKAASLAARRQELKESAASVAESLVAALARLWTCMRGVEVGLNEMTASMEGTDPLKPAHRQRLVKLRQDLETLMACMEEYDLGVERREPDEEMLRYVRGTVPAMRVMMG